MNSGRERKEANITQAALVVAVASGSRTVGDIYSFLNEKYGKMVRGRLVPFRSKVSIFSNLKRLEKKGLMIGNLERAEILASRRKPNEDLDKIKRTMKTNIYYLNVYGDPSKLANIFKMLWKTEEDYGIEVAKDFMKTEWYYHICVEVVNSLLGPPPKKHVKLMGEDEVQHTEIDSSKNQPMKSEYNILDDSFDPLSFFATLEDTIIREEANKLSTMLNGFFEDKKIRGVFINLIQSFPRSANRFFEEIIRKTETVGHPPEIDSKTQHEIEDSSELDFAKDYPDEIRKRLVEMARYPLLYKDYKKVFEEIFPSYETQRKFYTDFLEELLSSVEYDDIVLTIGEKIRYLAL
jgi:hypothetical protein